MIDVFSYDLMFIPQNIVDDLRQRDCEELYDRLELKSIGIKPIVSYTRICSQPPSFHPSKKMYGIAFHVVRGRGCNQFYDGV